MTCKEKLHPDTEVYLFRDIKNKFYMNFLKLMWTSRIPKHIASVPKYLGCTVTKHTRIVKRI